MYQGIPDRKRVAIILDVAEESNHGGTGRRCTVAKITAVEN